MFLIVNGIKEIGIVTVLYRCTPLIVFMPLDNDTTYSVVSFCRLSHAAAYAQVAFRCNPWLSP